jgi:hypothetical protein
MNIRVHMGDRDIGWTLYYVYSIEMGLNEITCENVVYVADNHGGVLGTRQ